MNLRVSSARAGLVGIVAALIVTAVAGIAAGSGPVIWTEGESYTATPPVRGKKTAKSPAISEGLGLYGYIMGSGKATVSYDVTAPAAIAEAQLIFRYQRYHWRRTMKPVPVRIQLAGGGTTITREVSFGDTRGRGEKPAHWRVLAVDLGDLAPGKWKVTLTSEAKDTAVNIDGFFIAGGDFVLTAEELASLIRLKITSDGYIGLRAETTAIRQHKVGKIDVTIRTFSAVTGAVKAAAVTPDGATMPLKREAGANGNVVFALPKLTDGDYTLRLASEMPAATVDVPVKLIGDFLARVDQTLARLEPMAARLAKADTRVAKRCAGDFEHAVGYLQAGRDVMHGETSTTRPTCCR